MKAAMVVFLWALAALAGAAGCAGSSEGYRTNLRTAVDAQRPALAACYGDSLSRNRAAGRIDLGLHVDSRTGRVDRVDFTSSEMTDAQLHGCFERTLTTVSLSEPPSDDLYVQYTFELAAMSVQPTQGQPMQQTTVR